MQQAESQHGGRSVYFDSINLVSSGPMPLISSTTSLSAQTKCDVFAGRDTNEPGGSNTPLDLSLLPKVIPNVPRRTITFSMFGCV